MSEVYSDITDELSYNFLAYAAAVNTDRAIPDAKSGLKPVARRILYDMYNTGLTSNKPHVKCAKIVGDTVGRFHPHGDSSVYEALVRLAQPWVLRYPLIDFHGNKGNLGGDGAAAMRYTEARLSRISEFGMLEGLKKKVVDFQPNYSEDEDEPTTLVSLFPNLLCNPNAGIGVAMACNWLPHNLTEVSNAIIAYLNNPNITITELVNNYLPAPDFPLGGTIINKDNMLSCYKTGKGRVIIQGKWELETRGTKKLIVFKEIPFGVNTETLLGQINQLYTAKNDMGVEEIRDESNKNGLRIVIEVSTNSPSTIKKIVSKLYKETDLQKNVSFNQVALVDKVPRLLNLKDVINVYVEHQLEMIKRETQFDLSKAEDRLKIVDGLLIALEDIDNVIKLVKESKSSADAVVQLCKKYNLFEEQAKAIVNMKLGTLAGLEKIKLQTEQTELTQTIEELTHILTFEEDRIIILRHRLEEFAKKYGDERRTRLAQITLTAEEKAVEAIEPQDVVVVLSKGGHIKRIPVKNFRIQKRGGKGIKSKDESVLDIIKTNTIDTLIMFSSAGKIYKVVVDDVPESPSIGLGTPINTLIKSAPGEEIIAITSHHRESDAEYVVFITAHGMIKKTKVSEYATGGRSLAGLLALKLKEGDSIIDITFLKEQELIMISEQGMAIRVKTNDITPVGRSAMGVKGMKLNDDDQVVAALPVHKTTDNLAIFTRSGLGKKMSLSDFALQGRNGKGVSCYKNDVIAGAAMVSDEDNILIIGSQTNIGISAKEIPVGSRIAAGSSMIKNSMILSTVKI